MARKRQQRSNLNGQEEMVSAMWEFAADVERMVDEHDTWLREKRPDGRPLEMTPAKHDALRKAMERIADGFGYRIVEIQ